MNSGISRAKLGLSQWTTQRSVIKGIALFSAICKMCIRSELSRSWKGGGCQEVEQ